MVALTSKQEWLLAWCVFLVIGAIAIHVQLWRHERGRRHRDP